MVATQSIEAIAASVKDAAIVRALFLSGSYGAGIEDAYSDIDFLVVAVGGMNEDFARLWREAVGRTGEIVLWWGHVKSNLISAMTSDWLRVDVEVVPPEQIGRRSKSSLKVVFDHDRLYDALPATVERASPNPQMLRRQFEGFFRVFGLMTLGLGRKEYETGVTGVFHLRTYLIDLLIEETGAPNRGGALHLNRLITQEQKDLMASLPPIRPTKEALIAANLAYAAAYLPRARRLAKRLGVEWPERFEVATWAHLKRELGIDRPPE